MLRQVVLQGAAYLRAAGQRAHAGSWRTFAGHAPAAAASSASATTLAQAAEAGSRAGRAARPPPDFRRRVRALLRDYAALSKARLSALVVTTTAAGYVAASPAAIDWAGLAWASAGTALCSAAAAALNQAYERDSDALMRRTAARPLPAGRVSRAHAVAFALAAGAAGVGLLATKANTLTAGLGAANIVLYAGVYTPLKTVSVVNTWVGAVVGAVPPLMGWAAAAGGLDVGAAILAAGLYFWQLPHFMALAWISRADYAAGGHRMLPALDPTGRRVAACALRNCFYLFPLGLLAAWLGVTTPYFAYESAFITAGLTLCAAKFLSRPSTANARLLFRASLLHLPLFMAAFVVHRLPNTSPDRAGLLLEQARKLGLVGGGVMTARGSTMHSPSPATIQSTSTPANTDASPHRGASLFGWRMDDAPAAPPLSVLVPPRFGLACPSVAVAQEQAVEVRRGDAEGHAPPR